MGREEILSLLLWALLFRIAVFAARVLGLPLHSAPMHSLLRPFLLSSLLSPRKGTRDILQSNRAQFSIMFSDMIIMIYQ